MSELTRVKVINSGNDLIGTECYINDQKTECVRAVDFRAVVDEVPTFTFEVMGLPEIDMPGDIRFSFTPQTVAEAVKVLWNELLKHNDVYDGFLASIRSAIKELPEDKAIWADELAEMILKRVIGEDKHET